jgi:hypothetical protein
MTAEAVPHEKIRAQSGSHQRAILEDVVKHLCFRVRYKDYNALHAKYMKIKGRLHNMSERFESLLSEINASRTILERQIRGFETRERDELDQTLGRLESLIEVHYAQEKELLSHFDSSVEPEASWSLKSRKRGRKLVLTRDNGESRSESS